MSKKNLVSRRDFVKSTAALAAASTFTIIKPQSVRGSQANSMIEIGWVGNGGQGTRDATLLEATKGAKIVALADYFQDQLDKARDKFKVDPKNAHLGIDAYKAIMGSKVDAVLLTTPPGFRSEHFKAAVTAKKQVFMEKPLAVDVPGCHVVAKAGEEAKAQKLTVIVGLQRHYSKAYRKCKELIDQGALGKIVMAHSAWDQGDLWRKETRDKMPSEEAYEIRNWLYFRWLSGDHIVEQNIHNIDVINWMLGTHPTKASGSGGRLARTDIGDIYDHFSLVYEYPNQIFSSNTCVQINGVHGDVSETIRGTKGTFTTTAGKGGTGGARIEGLKGRNDPDTPTIYKHEGADDKHYDQEAEAFVASVKGAGERRNDTQYGVESTFTAILGREAAYRGEVLAWDKLWQETHRLTFQASKG